MLGRFGYSADKFHRLIPAEFPVRYAEVVGWGPVGALASFISELEDSGVTIAEIHGRTGFENRAGTLDTLKLAGIMLTLVSTPALLDRFSGYELLMHAPEVSAKLVQRSILRKPPKFVWVENHKQGDEGVAEAQGLVRFFRTHRIPAAVMFDGCHYIGPEALTAKSLFYPAWDRMLVARNGTWIRGEHVSVNTDPKDGYPLDWISKDMWRAFAGRRPKRIRRTVIENQQRDRPIAVGRKGMEEILSRNGRIFSLFAQTGVAEFTA